MRLLPSALPVAMGGLDGVTYHCAHDATHPLADAPGLCRAKTSANAECGAQLKNTLMEALKDKDTRPDLTDPSIAKRKQMALIEVTGGGIEVDAGSYRVTLISLGLDPEDVIAKTGPNAGQPFSYLEWVFAIDDGQPFAGKELPYRSPSNGKPAGKTMKAVKALFGGKTAPKGTQLDPKDLIGRGCLATVSDEETGYMEIESFAPLPVVAAAPAVPAAPAAATPANGVPDLPF